MSYTLQEGHKEGDWIVQFESEPVGCFVSEDEARFYIAMKTQWGGEEMTRIWLDVYKVGIAHHVETHTSSRDTIEAAQLAADAAVRSILNGRVYGVIKSVADELNVTKPLA